MYVCLTSHLFIIITARLTKDKKGQVSEVHLSPGIDIDDTLLTTLAHLAQVMVQLGHLKVNSLKVKGIDLEGDNGEEYKRIVRFVTLKNP